MSMREIQKDIYKRVIEIIIANDEADLRLWNIAQTLFEYALFQLDPEKRGLAITYAKLMPVREDNTIHTLKEAFMRGHDPWPHSSTIPVFLGNTTLAGHVAAFQRLQVWSDENEGRIPVQVDTYEHSACAAPLLRGSKIAGVLLVSSTQSAFFHDQQKSDAVNEYAQLFSIAIPPEDFQSPEVLQLRPMPNLEEQRMRLNEIFINMVTHYVTKEKLSHKEAQLKAECALEKEFAEQADQ